MNVSTQFPNLSASVALSSPTKLADQPVESASQPSAVAPVEGIKVSLSGAGIQKASEEKKPRSNADIEASGLPDETQKLLKTIRELKQKIEEKQQELQALMADQSMNPETKQARVGALQSVLAALTANLMTASNNLDKQTKNGTLTAAQSQQAAGLLMKN